MNYYLENLPNKITVGVAVVQDISTRLSTRYRACNEYIIGIQDRPQKAIMKPNPDSSKVESRDS